MKLLEKSKKKYKILENFPAFSLRVACGNNDFDSSSFDLLASVEDDYFWFEERNKLILWAINKYFPEIKNFLEIGCGTGFVSRGIMKKFPNLEFYGSEIYIEGLKKASDRIPKESLFQMDAREMPFEDDFEAIGLFDVLEHIEEDELVLNQIYKSLKKEGWLVLTVPQHMFLWSQSDNYACHKRRYSKKELLSKIEHAGFKIVRTTSFMSFLMPLVYLSRVSNQKKENFDIMKEFRISKWMNFIFGKMMALERKLIERSGNFSMGSSRLVVAKKK
jgi:ubiquinone/menaquinone biosynthesis C-methylase UbiE